MSDVDQEPGQRRTGWPDVAGCLVICVFFLGLIALCGWLGVIGNR